MQDDDGIDQGYVVDHQDRWTVYREILQPIDLVYLRQQGKTDRAQQES
jgi:hypothetical protein